MGAGGVAVAARAADEVAGTVKKKGKPHCGLPTFLYAPSPACGGRPGWGRPYTSFWFLSGSERTGLPVAAWIALSTEGVTTQIVGSPTPPQKS
jgi:hypothetical protein